MRLEEPFCRRNLDSYESIMTSGLFVELIQTSELSTLKQKQRYDVFTTVLAADTI